MERSAALKKLGKILGKEFCYRVDPNAPTSEERATAATSLPETIASRNDLRARRDARRVEILAGDAEYQALIVSTRAATEVVERLSGICAHYKITVGISESIFFSVKAQGDSWGDVIAQLELKAAEPTP